MRYIKRAAVKTHVLNSKAHDREEPKKLQVNLKNATAPYDLEYGILSRLFTTPLLQHSWMNTRIKAKRFEFQKPNTNSINKSALKMGSFPLKSCLLDAGEMFILYLRRFPTEQTTK